MLIAAATVAIALAAVLAAYLQLGYAADAAAAQEYDDPTRDAERSLERVVHGAAHGVPANYSWRRREAARGEVKSDLGPRIDGLEAARVESGTAYSVSYNGTAARQYAAESCPSGHGREFGPCDAGGGVVLQERAGESHVVAVAFDLTVVGERRTVEETIVVDPVRGVVRR